MQDAGARLLSRPRLGLEVFRRGAPERFRGIRTAVYEITLFDLLKAYGDHHRRRQTSTLHISPNELFTVEQALARLQRLLGRTPDWQSISSFLPPGIREGLVARSALASTFVASLELARSGRVQIRQNTPFGPIYIKPGDGSGRKEGPKQVKPV